MTGVQTRSEEHTSELQSHDNLVCRLLLEKKKKNIRLDDSQQRSTHPRIALARVVTPRAHHYVLYMCVTHETFVPPLFFFFFFFFNDTATPEIYPLSLHDALPI